MPNGATFSVAGRRDFIHFLARRRALCSFAQNTAAFTRQRSTRILLVYFFLEGRSDVSQVGRDRCARFCDRAERSTCAVVSLDRRHRPRRHVDVGGRVARWPHRSPSIYRGASGRSGRRRCGGAHHDVFNDARQPTWSPDGNWITFFAYRDAVRTSGDRAGRLESTQADVGRRSTTASRFWSHDGSRVAFSSDRGNPLGSDYNIWTLDVGTGNLRR